MTERFEAAALTEFARDLFAAAGLEPDKAAAVATYLVAADLMGHATHGLALAGWYLQSIADGVMTRAGAPEVVSDRGAAVCRRGRLPGAWLTSEAVKLAADRALAHGTATVVIGDSHHIGALAAYLTLATDRGLMVSIASSSPSGAQVAPFGGRVGVYTPDPVAHGIPTDGEPILIDISPSITTVNMAQRMIREGRSYDHDWLLDRDGNRTRDPRAVLDGGTLLPTGGLDHGQKGYGMALQAEALTQGLAGFGRADAPKGTNAAVTVQVWDPEAFGGRTAFLRQTGWLADACRTNPPRPGVEAVRLPGQAALARRRAALADGVALHPGIMDDLVPHAKRLGVPRPTGWSRHEGLVAGTRPRDVGRRPQPRLRSISVPPNRRSREWVRCSCISRSAVSPSPSRIDAKIAECSPTRPSAGTSPSSATGRCWAEPSPPARSICRWFAPGDAGVAVIDVPVEGLPDRFGVLSPRCGEACFRYIRTAVELAQAGKAAGIVTAPINKEALNSAGHHYDGHTGLLAHLTGQKASWMLLASERLNVIHVSTHVSLRTAIDRAKPERVLDTIRTGHRHLRRMGLDSPRIAVAGINPHCGESGLFGTEDDENLAPAVAAARAEGIDVVGPISADTVYYRAYNGAFDLVVAQYHDQGHIPIKLVAFDTAVNVSLGLPIDRSSVDHGTAFDIAGTGRANHVNMLSALSYARGLVKNPRQAVSV